MHTAHVHSVLVHLEAARVNYTQNMKSVQGTDLNLTLLAFISAVKLDSFSFPPLSWYVFAFLFSEILLPCMGLKKINDNSISEPSCNSKVKS